MTTGAAFPQDPVFNEPWEARAFAITVALHQQGAYSWPEWAEELATQRADAESDGTGYYLDWLTALERLSTAKGLTTDKILTELRIAWQEAGARTPHGQPIKLSGASE